MIKCNRTIGVALLVTTLILSIGSAWAEPLPPAGEPSAPPVAVVALPTHAQRMELNRCMHMMREQVRERAMGLNFAWQLDFDQDKKLTQQEATTIAQAALLMSGHKELAVGKVTPMPKGERMFYRIDIVNRAGGKVVRQLVLNGANGFIRPLPPQWEHRTAPAKQANQPKA